MKPILSLLCAICFLPVGVQAQGSGPLLSGTPIGSAPWQGLAQGDKFKAFDGDTDTAFDSEANFIYVGLDLGSAQSITRIRYYPRGTLASRMAGGRIRGANTPDLGDAVTIYTIPTAPPEGAWQDVTLPAPSAAYRYIFYTTAADGYGNVAELQFYGAAPGQPPAPAAPGQLTGTPIGTTPFQNMPTYDKFKAFDGDLTTIFDSEASFLYVGLDFGSAKNVTRIRFYPRELYNQRMLNGRFRVANAADLSDAVTLYTVTSIPPAGVWQDVAVTTPGSGYRYFFFTTDLDGHGNLAELEAYGSAPPSGGGSGSGIFTDPVTGDVGIGTNNPAGYKLAVNGSIHAKEVVIESDPALWPDYVFAESHALMSLDAVEAHIKEHKHLPGVPSAQDISEKGLGVSQMQAAILAKVEELTLHVIEQEKRIKRLEEENSALRASRIAP
jgi:hypothetical protein